jgi:DNA helicase-2/ATP-dependent DNA helicase PcrA
MKTGAMVAFNKDIADEMTKLLMQGGEQIASPSYYQQAIFDFVQQPEGGNCQVSAVPGSGKTTTQMHNTTLLSDVSFEARTIHSAGMRMVSRHLGGAKLDKGKMWKIIRDMTERIPYGPEKQLIQYSLKDIGRFIKLTNIDYNDPEQVKKLGMVNDIMGVTEAMPYVARMMDRSDHEANQNCNIDYDDMIYLPVAWDLSVKHPHDWLLVDEMQDLNAAQWNICRKLLKPGGRGIFVGDPRQSMYLFAGASANTFGEIAHLFGEYTSLPLSISYRCPTSHLDIARMINPEIEGRANAPVGTIEHMNSLDWADAVKEGDMVLCRFNAPLFTNCIELIRQGRPAYIKGRGIHAKLTRIIDEVKLLAGFDWAYFPTYLETWKAHEIQNTKARNAGEAENLIAFLVNMVEDKVSCLHACYDGAGVSSPDTLKEYIKALFHPRRNSVVFSTIHKAKGGQADRVHILGYDDLPYITDTTSAAQAEQELNIKYVAVTRSTDYLGLVSD